MSWSEGGFGVYDVGNIGNRREDGMKKDVIVEIYD